MDTSGGSWKGGAAGRAGPSAERAGPLEPRARSVPKRIGNSAIQQGLAGSLWERVEIGEDGGLQLRGPRQVLSYKKGC